MPAGFAASLSTDDWFNLTLGLCDLLGLAAGTRLLLARSTQRPLIQDGVTWAILSVIWGVIVCAAVLVLTGSRFGTLQAITHGTFVVAAPLAVGRGAQRLLRRRRDGIIPLIAGALMLGTWVWATRIEPFRLEVSRHTVTSPRIAERVRIAILSDIQTDRIGEWEREVFAALDEEKPDLVLFPGDYLQVWSRAEFDAERHKLIGLIDRVANQPRLGWWAVPGDIDQYGSPFDGSRVRWMTDQSEDLLPWLRLTCLSQMSSRMIPSSWVREALDRHDGFPILMGHAPDYALRTIRGGAKAWRPDALFVAGHTHGGQIVVPGFGPPVTLSSVPRDVARGDLHRFGATWMCVSRGIGLERGLAPRVRLFCRPEIVVIDLEPLGP